MLPGPFRSAISPVMATNGIGFSSCDRSWGIWLSVANVFTTRTAAVSVENVITMERVEWFPSFLRTHVGEYASLQVQYRSTDYLTCRDNGGILQ